MTPIRKCAEFYLLILTIERDRASLTHCEVAGVINMKNKIQAIPQEIKVNDKNNSKKQRHYNKICFFDTGLLA